jgi:DNA-directed RNA polymerase specialized sigma24 family protein
MNPNLTAEMLPADPQMQRIALRHAPPHLVEDALQEAAVRMLEHLPPTHTSPRAWAVLTLKRLCWRLAKQERTRRLASTDAVLRRNHRWDTGSDLIAQTPQDRLQSEPSEIVADRLELEELRRSMPLLKPDEATVLCELALGFSYREIGQRRNWTYTKVNRCAVKGRARLRASVASVPEIPVAA